MINSGIYWTFAELKLLENPLWGDMKLKELTSKQWHSSKSIERRLCALYFSRIENTQFEIERKMKQIDRNNVIFFGKSESVSPRGRFEFDKYECYMRAREHAHYAGCEHNSFVSKKMWKKTCTNKNKCSLLLCARALYAVAVLFQS